MGYRLKEMATFHVVPLSIVLQSWDLVSSLIWFLVFSFRSATLASALSRSISFSHLPLQREGLDTSVEGLDTSAEGLDTSAESDYVSSRSVSSLSLRGGAASPTNTTEEVADFNVGVGGYLGRFVPGEQG